MRSLFVSAIVLAGSVGLSGSEGAKEEALRPVPDKFGVTLVAVQTPEAGATTDGASAGPNLRIGEEGTMYLLTGSLDSAGRPVDALCAGSVGSGKATESAIEDAVHAWRAKARLLDATMESATVALEWSREDVDASGTRRIGVRDRRTVTLREGQRHSLDYVSAAEKPGPCGSSLRVDVAVSVVEDERLRDERIRYELWLVDEVPGRPTGTRRFETTGRHGEQIDFVFDPLRFETGARFDDGTDAEVLAKLAGTVRGRVREDGTIETILDASRFIGIGRRGHTSGGIGDGGRKSVRIAPGETLGLVLPPAQGSHSVTFDLERSVVGGDVGETPSGSTAGVDVRDDNELVVDFGKFFARHKMSLRLTATRVGSF